MGEFVWVLCLRKGGGNPWQGPLGREMDMSRAPSKSPTSTKSFHQTSSPRGHKLVHGNRLTYPPPLEECHKLKKSAPAKTAAPAPARKRTRRTTALEAEAKAEAERQAIEGASASAHQDLATNQEEDADVPTDKGSTKAVFLAGAEAYDEALRFVSSGDTPPSVDEATLRSMLAPATDDHYWGDADETALLAEWATASLRPVIASANSNQVKHNRTLWKACAQYFGCLPAHIACPANRLAISWDSQKRIAGDARLSPFWPDTMCRAFVEMMWHPFWQDGHMSSLVAVLQFTVMVRTDDRRTWELRNEMGDAFIDHLIAEVNLDRPLSLAERRRPVALCRAADARRPPTWRRSDFSRLFEIIADKFKDNEVERSKVPKGSFVETPYIVDIKDLRAIGSALGLMGSSTTRPPPTSQCTGTLPRPTRHSYRR